MGLINSLLPTFYLLVNQKNALALKIVALIVQCPIQFSFLDRKF